MSTQNRTKSSSKNVISGILNKFILLILSFISRKFFVHYIGIEYLGINGLFSNVLQLLSMADLGFGIAMTYSYYKPLAENDQNRLAGLTTFYKKIYNIIACSVAAIGLLLIPFLKYIVNMDQPIPHLYLIYIISLSNTVVSYLFIYKSAIINADQKAYLVNQVNIYINVVKLMVQCALIYFTHNYFAYIGAEVAATIANNLVVSYTAERLYPYIKETSSLDLQEKNEIFRNIKSVFIYKISAAIMGGTDSIIMSKIAGTIVVGYYSNYLTITNQLSAFVQIVFSSLTASVGNLLTEKRAERNYEVFKIMQMISHWLSATITISILVLIQDFISLWLGTDYLMSNRMVWAIAINIYFSISMQPIWSYRDASGLYRKTKYIMLATAILNIFLSIVLGIALGAEGVIIATVIARLVTYFWYEPLIIYRTYFHKRSASYYFDYLICISIIIFAYFIINYILIKLSLKVTWGHWIVKVVITQMVIALMFFVRYCTTKEFKQCVNKLKFSINKKK